MLIQMPEAFPFWAAYKDQKAAVDDALEQAIDQVAKTVGHEGVGALFVHDVKQDALLKSA